LPHVVAVAVASLGGAALLSLWVNSDCNTATLPHCHIARLPHPSEIEDNQCACS